MADSNFNTPNPPKVDGEYRSFEYIQQAKAVNDLLYIALTSNEPIRVQLLQRACEIQLL